MRKPLLATYGVNEDGKLYVHIKVFKQQRIYGEVLVVDGRVKLHCRECLRWHTVIFVQPEKAELKQDEEPPIIPAVNVSPMIAG